MRATLLVSLAVTLPLAAQTPPSPPVPLPPPAPAPAPAVKRTLELTGLVLVNGFFTNARVNNSDVPQFADSLAPASAVGGTIRQTRLGLLVTEPDVLRGSFSGEVDLDFFGGQQPSSGGRTFPLVRLRRAVGIVSWAHAQLLFGQESPLVAERSPRSLASVGFPDFAAAGNLWLWLPQFRVTLEQGYSLRLAEQVAVLAPTSGTAQGLFNTQPDSAERSRRPYLQARVRLAWGPTDDPNEIAIGGHLGWLASADTLFQSRAVTADARFQVGSVELLAEAFSGKALAGLGGGGIGQSLGPTGQEVRTTGGWGQLNVRPRREVVVGAGCGIDDPDDGDLSDALGNPQGRLKNLVCAGHVEVRPRGPLVFGVEFRRFETTYPSGKFTANHFNLAAGYRF
ncbi:MAG: hypothetical protein DMD70_13050 [Gemmatimonadetes bacterium]|nr:MAG: hypothetical protein DMD70_13050 [Gemmatimonadota bacterium]